MALRIWVFSSLLALVACSPLPEPEISFGSTTPAPNIDDAHRNLSSICVSMKPAHGEAQPQATPAPFIVEVDKTKAQVDESVQVTVRGNTEKQTFKGFYIQARNSNGEPVGEFQPTDAEHVLYHNCGHGHNNALSFIRREPETAFSIRWAGQESGTVQFWVTVVESYSQFWVGVKSEEVKIEKDP